MRRGRDKPAGKSPARACRQARLEPLRSRSTAAFLSIGGSAIFWGFFRCLGSSLPPFLEVNSNAFANSLAHNVFFLVRDFGPCFEGFRS